MAETGRSLDVVGAARFLGEDQSRLQRARTEGFGPPWFKVGGKVHYAESALSAWMYANPAGLLAEGRKGKPGRPIKKKGGTAKSVMTARIPVEMREALEVEAQRTGRSIGEVAALWLEFGRHWIKLQNPTTSTPNQLG